MNTILFILFMFCCLAFWEEAKGEWEPKEELAPETRPYIVISTDDNPTTFDKVIYNHQDDTKKTD